MVKKIYVTAVVLFILTALFINDKPDFPKSAEVELVSESISVNELYRYEGSEENRNYYNVTCDKRYEIEDIQLSARCEVICRITSDENDVRKVTLVESIQSYGGGAGGFRWEEVTSYSDINNMYGFAYCGGCFTKEEDVSYTPMVKVLPGMFLDNVDFTLKNYYRTEMVDIRLRLRREEIISMSQTIL